MKVELVTETKGVGKLDGKSLEEIVGYIARVSNPKNQDNENVEGLLKYCMKHKHWSIFETVALGFEIETSRAISAQMLRHRSFTFQEFSQRYSNDLMELEVAEARSQDPKNRQDSVDDLEEDIKDLFKKVQLNRFTTVKAELALQNLRGVAKECSRMLLPLGTRTRLYMTGNLRNWMHYIVLRSANGTQKEHQDIAKEMHSIIGERYPLTSRLLDYMIKSDEKHKEILESLEV